MLYFCTRFQAAETATLQVRNSKAIRIVADAEIAIINKTKDMNENIEIMAKLEEIKQISLLGAKDVFNIDDVAAYTGLSKGYIYKLTHERRIPFAKGGGKMLFFKREDINAWLLQNKVSSQQELEQMAAAYVLNNPRKGGRK